MLKLRNDIICVRNKQYAVGQGGLHLSIITYVLNDKIEHDAYIYDCGALKPDVINSAIGLYIKIPQLVILKSKINILTEFK